MHRQILELLEFNGSCFRFFSSSFSTEAAASEVGQEEGSEHAEFLLEN